MSRRMGQNLSALVHAVAILWVGAATSDACTVFVMTDGRQVLFCNNEDFSNPNTRIWFMPGSQGRHGCVYVGFDDGWGQGGCNTQGLAFDWVAGFKEQWERPEGSQTAKGNSCQRMLETCSTVEEAMATFSGIGRNRFPMASCWSATAAASPCCWAQRMAVWLPRS